MTRVSELWRKHNQHLLTTRLEFNNLKPVCVCVSVSLFNLRVLLVQHPRWFKWTRKGRKCGRITNAASSFCERFPKRPLWRYLMLWKCRENSRTFWTSFIYILTFAPTAILIRKWRPCSRTTTVRRSLAWSLRTIITGILHSNRIRMLNRWELWLTGWAFLLSREPHCFILI